MERYTGVDKINRVARTRNKFVRPTGTPGHGKRNGQFRGRYVTGCTDRRVAPRRRHVHSNAVPIGDDDVHAVLRHGSDPSALESVPERIPQLFTDPNRLRSGHAGRRGLCLALHSGPRCGPAHPIRTSDGDISFIGGLSHGRPVISAQLAGLSRHVPHLFVVVRADICPLECSGISPCAQCETRLRQHSDVGDHRLGGGRVEFRLFLAPRRRPRRCGRRSSFILSQNYPNPFNPTTTINYAIPKSSFVTIKVYDLLGNEVAALVSGMKASGNYKVEFNASKLSSGVYFYRIQAGSFVKTKKLILLK